MTKFKTLVAAAAAVFAFGFAAATAEALPQPSGPVAFTAASNLSDVHSVRAAAPFAVNLGPVHSLDFGVDATHFNRGDVNAVGVNSAYRFNVPLLPLSATIDGGVGYGVAGSGRNGAVLNYGLGVDYRVNDHWSIGAENRTYNFRHRDDNVTGLRVSYH